MTGRTVTEAEDLREGDRIAYRLNGREYIVTLRLDRHGDLYTDATHSPLWYLTRHGGWAHPSLAEVRLIGTPEESP